MSHKPTIYTYFDNRDGQMIVRESAMFFNCDYDPIHREVRTAFFSELRTAAKRQEAINSRRTFLCGCCKRPLKIVGGTENGKKCFHFMHIEVPPKGECVYYERVPLSGEEIKAMLFHGRTESLQHRQTKGIISSVLTSEPDVVNIAVEAVAKNIGKTWRKPDIRADFKDKTVVFEVQLSPIFHHVILERNDAYRDNGWYICWVFDDVNNDNPVMRKLDAWVNNNYNLFGFDAKAKAATEKTGRLHLTIKYYVFSVIEDGLESRLGGEWHTETVQFSSLNFDTHQRMVYLHDSNSEKQKCVERIHLIISDHRKRIEDAERLAQLEADRKKEEESKRVLEEQIIEEEQRRVVMLRQKVIDFIYNVPCCIFPSDMFERVLEYINRMDEKEVDVLLTNIVKNLRSFEADAMNKWLKVICEIVKSKGIGEQKAKMVWNEVIYTFEIDKRKIDYLSLKDYFNVFGPHDYSRVLNLLTIPYDSETSNFLYSIKDTNKDFKFYAPLIILNRYFSAKQFIPERIIQFFTEKTKEIWCLISAQQGKSFGYEKMNLKQVANLVCNCYPDIAPLFLYLIDRNGYAYLVSEVKTKFGKKTVNHYQRLKECAELQIPFLKREELNIMFPEKKTTILH